VLTKNNPEYFYPDINIAAIYGCFPGQIWNGGRYIAYESVDIETIKITIDSINVLGVPVRFTYTNSLLEECHLSDERCNFITKYANNGMNEILTNSELLEDYLRKTYPNYEYISSTTKCIRDVDKINELIESNKYKLVLGDFRDNFDFDFLSKIKRKDKIELLVNCWCDRNCVLREMHYKHVSKLQLGLVTEEFQSNCHIGDLPWYEVVKSDHIIKVEDLYSKYLDMGFYNFKLEGRNFNPIDVVDSYVYYLVLPEYRDMIRNILLKSLFI
jgi:hypothetical protein